MRAQEASAVKGVHVIVLQRCRSSPLLIGDSYLDESCSRLVRGGSLRESRKGKWRGVSTPKDGRRGRQLGCTERT